MQMHDLWRTTTPQGRLDRMSIVTPQVRRLEYGVAGVVCVLGRFVCGVCYWVLDGTSLLTCNHCEIQTPLLAPLLRFGPNTPYIARRGHCEDQA